MKDSLFDHPWYVGAFDVLDKAGYESNGIQTVPSPLLSKGQTIQIKVMATADEVIELNFRLADHLASQGLIPTPEGEMNITILFVPN